LGRGRSTRAAAGAFLTANDLRSTFAAESLSSGLCNPYLADINHPVAALNLLMRQARETFFDESGDRISAEVTACKELLRQAMTASSHEHGESALLPGTEGRHHRRVPGRLLRHRHQLRSLPPEIPEPVRWQGVAATARILTSLAYGDASLANRHHIQPQELEGWHRRSGQEHDENGARGHRRAIAHDFGQMPSKSKLLVQRLPR
jgi:hypothetical protein